MNVEELAKEISKNLKRDIVIFDLETSSLPIDSTEIIQFWGLRINKNGKFKELKFLSCPEGNIDPKASQVHGFTKEKLCNEKPFSYFVKDIVAFFKNADIAGYNCEKFDCPILANQLKKHGIDNFLENRTIVDSYKIYLMHQDRKLNTCYKYYTDKNLENAHDASADGLATAEILCTQLKREGCTPEEMANKLFTKNKEKESTNLLDRYLIKQGEEWIINFSKNKGAKLSCVDKGFLSWIIKNDFPNDLKNIVKTYLKTDKETIKPHP